MASGQTSISATQNELSRLRKSIDQTRARIEALSNRESSAMNSLSSFQRKRHNLSVFINQLEADLSRLQDTARVVESRITDTQSALSRAEGSWRNASQSMIMYRREHRGQPPASLRIDAVYKATTTSLANYRSEMLTLKDSLSSQKQLLLDVSTTQEKIISAKERERSSLVVTITKSQQELQRLRSNKKTLVAELQKKQQSARRVRSLIGDLVAKQRAKEEERRRLSRAKKSDAASRGSTVDTPQSDVRTGATPEREGFRSNSLPWPTSSTSLLHGYGMYRNPETGTTLENRGTCVAKGQVSSVTWLPGYGSLVIVDHENGFRTVYANLATVAVKNGGAVTTGTTVGSSGENIDGKLVHFEIWFGRDRHNPLTYLR